MSVQKITTRFAPSPSGLLHLGHAYSALFAAKEAKDNDGTFILRFEDIDSERCNRQYEKHIEEDLTWLNIYWHDKPRRQSEHFPEYSAALKKLEALGIIYPCFLSRKELKAALSAPHDMPNKKNNPPPVLNTDQYISNPELERRITKGEPFALRLRMTAALELVGNLHWQDIEFGTQVAKPEIFGDVIIARKDIPTSYHLSVVVDDAIQGVTTVTRGNDLFSTTHLHRLLQELLDLPIPVYRHHKILTSENGKRLAKRDKSVTLQSLRESGAKPKDIFTMLGFV
jgi:glutamyl-Q tRNA(Asp) synthetase|tara:strand:- start:464 stop:1315 length:852 start_codon:yes stop_codon:yes gene_type:complete